MLEVIRLGLGEAHGESRTHAQFDLPPGPLEYREAWALQRRIHAEVVAGERPDTLLLLEHQAVYTAGKLTQEHERPTDGSEVVDIDRGGKITWHGPGQLVGYPIIALPVPIDVVGFVRALERSLVGVCAQVGVEGSVVEGRSGVWSLPPGQTPRKLCAIGLRVSQRVTMHGFALNCTGDLAWSRSIIPCGLDDADVTTLSREAGRPLEVGECVDLAATALQELVAERTPARGA